MLRVYNTLSRTKEPFETVKPGKVGMYLCGPTVYKPSHIGHMVGPVIFDAIKRYLVYSGYDVTWVVNVTDVDDKLINESSARGMPMAKLAEEMTADYMANIKALGVDTIDQFPRCTATMPEIIDFTKDLIAKGFAYEAQGDVYFDVSKDPGYGKLSHRGVEAMQGEGGGMAERKRNSADFALWKSAKPGEPSWDSPWGKGRPGWHIECSAMSRKILGETFDIHGGGLDLVFPHHENEIAQSECCHGGKPMAKYWMHNGLMQASDELGKVGGRATRPSEGDLASQEAGKISKSKGSEPFREMLKKFSGETVRFFLLSTHYRRPIDFSAERIREVETGMETFYRFFKRYENVTGESFYAINAPKTRKEGDFNPQFDHLLDQANQVRNRFLELMDDDFNTGGGIAELFNFMRILNKFIDDNKTRAAIETLDSHHQKPLKSVTKTFKELANTLGLFLKPVEKKGGLGEDLKKKLEDLLEAILNPIALPYPPSDVGGLMAEFIKIRAEARKKKDFATADRIRNGLTEIGVVLEDRPGGTEWSVKS
jgi:cysteinyl-tRNA synthetase